MKSFFLKKGYIIIPFKIMNSQHISCNLILNNKKGFFLIDTGASNSCIDKNKSIYFNLIKNDSEISFSSTADTEQQKANIARKFINAKQLVKGNPLTEDEKAEFEQFSKLDKITE